MSGRAGLETATCTDIGGRDEQQDRIAVFENGGAHLLALADGMGGHEGGALAAQAVIDVARESFVGPLDEDAGKLHERICHGAHERINALGAERGIAPHSTCVLLHVTESEATWTHVGDSRLYRFDGGRLVGRTVDHSVVELMRLQGKISEGEMKTHRDQNRLYEAVGRPQAAGGGDRQRGTLRRRRLRARERRAVGARRGRGARSVAGSGGPGRGGLGTCGDREVEGRAGVRQHFGGGGAVSTGETFRREPGLAGLEPLAAGMIAPARQWCWPGTEEGSDGGG